MLSEYQLKIIGGNTFFLLKNKKLIPSLDSKRNYKLHCQNLKLYLNFELQLKKINRVLKFKREQYLRPYIENTTDFQKEAGKEGNKIIKIGQLRNNAIFV